MQQKKSNWPSNNRYFFGMMLLPTLLGSNISFLKKGGPISEYITAAVNHNDKHT